MKLELLHTDVRQTWRALRARWPSSAAIVLILALGIGLATTMAALADPFIARALPYRQPDELVVLRIARPGELARPRVDGDGPVPVLDDWRTRRDLFVDVAAYGDLEQVRIPSSGGMTRLALRTVSPNFLAVLGLAESDSLQPSSSNAPRRLLVNPDRAPGALERLNGTHRSDRGALVELVPALPRAFLFPYPTVGLRPDAVSPALFGPIAVRQESGLVVSHWTGIGRLAPGVTAAQAQAALSTPRLSLSVEPLDAVMTAAVWRLALGAVIAGLLVVLLCVANVINLCVARGIYRAGDFAIRAHLGAGRADLARLLVFEIGVMSAAAVAAAVALAGLLLALVRQVIPEQYAAIDPPALTMRAVVFAAGLGAFVVLACFPPARIAAQTAAVPGARAASLESPRLRRFRFFMVGAQAALAMLLVMGAGFLIRSYANLWQQDTGFAGDARVVSVSYIGAAVRGSFDTAARTRAALERVPGVGQAAIAYGVGSLVDDFSSLGGHRYEVDGRQLPLIPTSEISANYFEVAGTTLVAGRVLSQADSLWASLVINRAFARLAWSALAPGETVGKMVLVNRQPATIVGVVQDAHDRALDRPAIPRVYRPLELRNGAIRISYVLRLEDQPAADTAIRRAIALADPGAHVEEIDSIDHRLAESIKDRSFATLTLTLFAGTGFSVMLVGLFAAVASLVARRTRDIAIRIALGAGAGQVRRFVLRETMIAAGLGIGLGFIAGWLLVRTLEHVLYGVTAGDVTIPIVAAVSFATVAAAAAWLPTRRALRIDPNLALRES